MHLDLVLEGPTPAGTRQLEGEYKELRNDDPREGPALPGSKSLIDDPPEDEIPSKKPKKKPNTCKGANDNNKNKTHE
jgi:hypothetical protein